MREFQFLYKLSPGTKYINALTQKNWGFVEAWTYMEERRSRFDVIADILSLALNGARKTQIMYKANLNFRRREKYLESLIGLGLIDVKSNSPIIYTTTERGREWLKNYEKIKLNN